MEYIQWFGNHKWPANPQAKGMQDIRQIVWLANAKVSAYLAPETMKTIQAQEMPMET